MLDGEFPLDVVVDDLLVGPDVLLVGVGVPPRLDALVHEERVAQDVEIVVEETEFHSLEQFFCQIGNTLIFALFE